jgi:GTP-binding protein EngB required for normal cell division
VTETDPLAALLHRCHRDELEPLARLLRVNAGQLGLGDLSRVLATQARRAGTHPGESLALRRGEGRSWHEVVEQALGRPVPPDGIEAAESELVGRWMAERLEKATPEERARLWAGMGLAGPPPACGVALEEARGRLGRRFAYVLAQVGSAATSPTGLAGLVAFLVLPPGCLVRVALLPFMPVVLWSLVRPSPERVAELVVQVARLRQVVRHRVTIGVVGSPSSGKDAAIKALFGIDSGNISPIAGSTKSVTIQALPGATALYVVNTPGLGDVLESVTEEARQVLDHIDVYLYVVNAEGGVQAREKADWDRCRATGKPSLAVVNKVDVLRPRDRDRYLADARQKLGVQDEDFLAVAFDPLPELSPRPINVEGVRAWLRRSLADLGKDPDEVG